MVEKKTISFKPKQVSKKILSSLNTRMKDIISNRYGLDKEKKMTLESIGKTYQVTRERVRQIENFALAIIKKSVEYKENDYVFNELKEIMKSIGSVVKEDDFLNHISKDKITQNHINLYLVIGGHFTKIKEDEKFHSHWSVDDFISKHIRNALNHLHEEISEQDILEEENILKKFIANLDELVDEYKNNKEIIHKYLSLSKIVGKNDIGEWGKKSSPHINARGVRDYAYLVIRKHGSPLHFKKVSEEIAKVFHKKINTATTHNELIKDNRFVLVGRGTYALKEWGHTEGLVRDVIIDIMKKNGSALSKIEIIQKVLEKRMVKANTVVINLQDKKYFKKDKDGKYFLK